MSTHEEKPPSQAQLDAMAYVDGELDAAEARRFEARLEGDPALLREVSELQALAVVARNAMPTEPIDVEWARIDTEPLQRSATGLGFGLVLVGTIAALLFFTWGIATADDMPVLAKAITLGIGGGLGLVFLAVLRRRMKSLPYDPYTKVKR